MKQEIIAWDLGATKCAAGIVTYDGDNASYVCQKKCSIKLAHATSLSDLINKIETRLERSMNEVDAICIGAAGHYNGESLMLEGVYPFPMHFASFAKQHKWPTYAIIHDYASIVCATFTSYINHSNNIKSLNACQMDPYGRRVAFGIGTGLGLKDGVLLPNGDFWLGKNEIGHIGIVAPPISKDIYFERHQEFIRFLQTQSDSHYPITFEKILSGA